MFRYSKYTQLHKAFTLIELLVVIGIIGILAAILFPVFAQAKTAAKAAVCLSNVKQVSLAAILYAADYDDMYPQQAVTLPKPTPNTTSRMFWWYTEVRQISPL